MKQYILAKQLEDLSEKPFLELEKWKTEKGYDSFPYREGGKWKGDTLSIGQMIEFLDESTGEDIKHFGDSYDCLERHIGKPWHHWFTIHWTKKMELCDALWEAVKEVLDE